MLNVMLLEMSPQPTHSLRHHKHFVMASQTRSCRCCNKSQHLHLHRHVHGPYALSSCTLFCHDSPLQSQSLVSGSAELWSISGQGSDLVYHQQYLLQQYSAVEPGTDATRRRPETMLVGTDVPLSIIVALFRPLAMIVLPTLTGTHGMII